MNIYINPIRYNLPKYPIPYLKGVVPAPLHSYATLSPSILFHSGINPFTLVYEPYIAISSQL